MKDNSRIYLINEPGAEEDDEKKGTKRQDSLKSNEEKEEKAGHGMLT